MSWCTVTVIPDVTRERNETAAVFQQLMSEHNYVGAGVALHRFGDLYAHIRPGGTSYEGDIGHGFDGHSPDQMFRTQARLRGSFGIKTNTIKVVAYSKALSTVVAKGFRSAGLTNASVATGSAGASASFQRFYGPATTQSGYIESIREEYFTILPSQMHVGSGFNTTPHHNNIANVMERLDN